MVNTDLRERRKIVLPKGLTLVEVMVAMLISAICLGTALQAYIGAVSIRAKSQEVNAAIAKMEANAETIRHLSQERPANLDTDCQGDYAQALMDRVTRDSAQEIVPETVVAIPERNRRGSRRSRRQPVQASSQTVPPSVLLSLRGSNLPSDYQLRRTMVIERNGSAQDVLRVSYDLTRSAPRARRQSLEGVALAANSSRQTLRRISLSQLSFSVMPNAALLCP